MERWYGMGSCYRLGVICRNESDEDSRNFEECLTINQLDREYSSPNHIESENSYRTVFFVKSFFIYFFAKRVRTSSSELFSRTSSLRFIEQSLLKSNEFYRLFMLTRSKAEASIATTATTENPKLGDIITMRIPINALEVKSPIPLIV